MNVRSIPTALLVPSQYGTIQAGIDAAKNGDTVIVADGIYCGVGNTNLDLHGKAITVRSASDNPTKCIIKCQGNAQGFVFRSGETASTVVRGFTITGGWAYQGGGVLCHWSSPTITRCIFDYNTALYDGGMLYCNGSNPTITDCALNEDSFTREVGELRKSSGAPAIANDTFLNHLAIYAFTQPEGFYDGGGI